MSYIYRKIEDTYVVWYTPANRYMQLQEPAFRILEDRSNELTDSQIVGNCAYQFKLEKGEAQRFVMEVTDQLQSLTSNYTEVNIVSPFDDTIHYAHQKWFTARYYLINGMNFRFRYSHPALEEMIHPGFEYLENKLPQSKAIHTFDLYYWDELAILQTDGQNRWKCPSSEPEHFVGLVFMQMMNCIHHLTDAHWMGAVHASAVSGGNGTVLFTAPSGSGKSTFAAMLMNKGYQVLSDDFSPISLNQSKVFPFPEGISVKNRSLYILQSYFPSLAKKEISLPYDIKEVFLPLTTGELPPPAPVSAIVFLQYNPYVEVELKKVPNLEVMDLFLQQLWLPPTDEVASRFMDWYFQIPCYTLAYSNNAKAINSLSKLFNP